VIHEDKVKVGSATKAPDYSFRLPGGKRLFFVEAKKPSVVVKTEILPAYQVRRYAWSAKLPVSILTDFEEFAVYDCNKKPRPDDKASSGRIKYITYNDYINEFDFLWDTFSKERVLKGSFDKYIAGDAGKKGTTTVDKEFLLSLDEWRIEMAQNIALRNPAFNEDDLNFAVQQTIDRIIFLRIAEDRGVEEYGKLKTVVSSPTAGAVYYQNLFSHFKEADSKYNSGLFDFKRDKLSASLQLDNKVLKDIINELYYPISPYEFSVLSVEILGSAYEQFLGKQIKLNDRHKAVIEEKPEVRKAGGVYYTPQYIVDYIVQQTVGKKIEELEKQFGSPKASSTGGGLLGAIKDLKIVDPACGSGSFLIGAFQFLLNYHHQYYKPEFERLTAIASSTEYNTKQRNDAIKERSKLPLTPDGALTTTLKKQILLNNIYGVDIDTQAVEVTKLSLLLKCMEGETQSSINAEMRFGERVLPTLDSNIKSGNSLIDLDFYDGEFDFEPGAEKKIKPFSWQKSFPQVFKDGGFDVVIGNPPYSLVGADRLTEQKYFSSDRYELNSYKINTYVLFLEKGLNILNEYAGRLGYIIPKSLVFNTYFESTRKKLLTTYCIPQLIEIREKVFEDAEVGDSLLFFGETRKNILDNMLNYYKVENVHPNFNVIKSFSTRQRDLLNNHLGKFFPSGIVLQSNTVPLSEICEVTNGLNPGNVRHILLSTERKNSNYMKMLLGRDIHPYIVSWSGTWVNYDPKLKMTLKPSDIKSKVGMTAQMKVDFALRDRNIYHGEKIVIRKTSDHIIAAIDSEDFYYDSLSYGIKLKDGIGLSLLFILGLLNSKLFNYLHNGLSDNKNKVFAKVLATNLSKLPIPEKILSTNVKKNLHDEIVRHIQSIVSFNKEKQQTTLPEKLEQLQHRINHTDDKINKLVYELYGLTKEEIKIVES
jgi:type I restriction-modification system DNA methylase subunit